jgi:hypothetical protein
MRCEGKNRQGKRCGAFALLGKSRCAIHADSGRAAALARKRRRLTATPQSPLKKFLPPQTARDLRQLLATSLIEVRHDLLVLDPGTAKAIAHLASVFLRTVEIGDIEERLARLESQQQEQLDHYSMRGRSIV